MTTSDITVDQSLLGELCRTIQHTIEQFMGESGISFFAGHCTLTPLSVHHRPGDDGSIGGMNGSRLPDALSPHTCVKSSAEYELALILKEIRFITDQVRIGGGPF